ncbi:MAG: hypothetical protein MJ090_01395 [Clostridia bacterium]|nr:hypothetical protein [Clostridia bacterium]
MSVGFRKSLFGFNSDDVMNYIEKTHKDFVEKETVLNEKIDQLSALLNSTKSQLSQTLAEKETIESELKEYTDKYDEIERLSQNIGRLYLVAENNAAAIIESAKQNRDISAEEVTRNISCADNTYSSLSSLREEIEKTSAEFSAKIQSLMASLNKAKADIYQNDLFGEKKIEEYEELVKSLKV